MVNSGRIFVFFTEKEEPELPEDENEKEATHTEKVVFFPPARGYS